MIQLRSIPAWARQRPITVGLASLVVLVTLLDRILRIPASAAHPGSAPVLTELATGHDLVLVQGHWWSLITYVLVSATWLHLIGTIALTLALLGWLEPLLPRRALVAAMAIVTVAGALVGIGIQAGGIALGLPLLTDAAKSAVVDPLTLVAGVVAFGSSWLAPVPRRRTRALLLVVLLIMFVYLGNASVLFRLGAAVGGFLLARIIRPEAEPEGWRPASEAERRTVIAWSTAALGLGPVIAMLVPHRHSIAAPLTSFLSPEPQRTPVCDIWRVTAECVSTRDSIVHLNAGELLASALPWLAFLVIAWGIGRGVRAASTIGAILNFAIAGMLLWFWGVAPLWFPDAGTGHPLAERADAVETISQLALILLLHLTAGIVMLAARRHARILVEPRRVLRAGAIVAGAAVVLLGGWVAYATSDAEPFDPMPTLLDAILISPERLLPPFLLSVSPNPLVPTSELAEGLSSAIAPIWTAISIFALTRLLRVPTPHLAGPDQATAMAILHEGGTSLSYLGVWPGNAYWLDDETGVCVAYRNVQGVAIVVGGPFGPGMGEPDAGERAVGVLGRFAAEAEASGLQPCVYSVPGAWNDALVAGGWNTLEVAEESVVDVAAWSTTGKKWQDIRTSINRTTKAGVELTWGEWDDLTVRRAREVRELNDIWVGDKPLPEMGFTLGGVDELALPGTLVCCAYDAEGGLIGVTSWLPTWRDGVLVGRTLDFMRRDPSSMNGVMEMMIARAAERFRDEGLEWMSLSGAPLANSALHGGADSGAPQGTAVLDRVLDQLGRLLEPMYGFRSLLGFKRKFQPEFRPLLLAYTDQAQLPNIGLAIGAAYLPGVSIGEAVSALRPRKDEPAESRG